MNHILEQVIGVPMKSTTYQVERTPKRYLPNSAGQYQVPSSAEGSNIFRKGKGNIVLKRMNKLGKKADTFAHGLREHGMKSTTLKVLIPLEKIKGVNESENMKKTSRKYMEIVTVDDFQFWFMGFLNYHKAFKIHDITSVCSGDISAPQETGRSVVNLMALQLRKQPPQHSAAPAGVGEYGAPTIGQPIGGSLFSTVGTPMNLLALVHMAYRVKAPVPGAMVPSAPMNIFYNVGHDIKSFI
ncbi:hypothetical protein Goarm_000378 [Gossypium armourianum]|uniref:GRAM domain-containing protein n=1 Tax=Gossypium armourianum TaxID=34283 RepID=A0A7J9K9M3_9ROSI|nr:hypothetical protein [Gossypium armourianum]